jgi:CoA:oxalate CoA-transferase
LQNFRLGVIEKNGLSYEEVRKLNPRIVYGSIRGYGKEGPWKNRPGQDLLLQSLSGLVWMTDTQEERPTPLGLSLVDMLVGANLLEGMLACLIRRGITGTGGHVEVSMLEAAVDMQDYGADTVY